MFLLLSKAQACIDWTDVALIAVWLRAAFLRWVHGHDVFGIHSRHRLPCRSSNTSLKKKVGELERELEKTMRELSSAKTSIKSMKSEVKGLRKVMSHNLRPLCLPSAQISFPLPRGLFRF